MHCYFSYEQAVDPIAPKFTGPIVPPQLTTSETLDAYFEVPVETGNGVKVNFVWLKNGEPVHFGTLSSKSLMYLHNNLTRDFS